MANDLTGVSREASAIERTGDVLQIALPLGALGWSLVQEDYRGSGQLFASFGVTIATTYALKFGFDRKRPSGGGLSFPSGHTASAFVGASYFQRRYGWHLGAPAYAMAAFTGYSRVHAEKHYWSDVIAGAALAIGVNHFLVDPLSDSQLSISPTADNGFQLSFSKAF